MTFQAGEPIRFEYVDGHGRLPVYVGGSEPESTYVITVVVGARGKYRVLYSYLADPSYQFLVDGERRAPTAAEKRAWAAERERNSRPLAARRHV